MRILFFADFFKPETGAAASHIHQRCQIWASQGHEVTVVTSAPNYPEGRVYPGYKNRLRQVEVMDGIRVVRVKTFISPKENAWRRLLDYLSYCTFALMNGLFERRPDVVLSSSPHLFVPVAGVLVALMKRVPHVIEVRDLWPASIIATNAIKPGQAYRMLERLELWLYRRSTRIIAFTHAFVGDMTSRGVPAGKIDVVINGANLELFQPRAQKDRQLVDQYGLAGRFVVGYLGTLGLAHGLSNVVQTAALLSGTNITFLLVGGGSERELLQAQVAERGLDNVVFAPRQSQVDLTRYWSVCDASLVHLSSSSLFAKVIPSKIFESMAVGLPIVYVGPAGEGSSLVESLGVGRWVPPADPAALAKAVVELSAYPQECTAMGQAGISAAPNYSRKKQAEATLGVLQQALDSPRR